MQHILKVVKVVNNRVVIDLPPGFADGEVEVILRPSSKEDDTVLELKKEIDIGMKSPVSPRSHQEIFDKLREEYDAC